MACKVWPKAISRCKRGITDLKYGNQHVNTFLTYYVLNTSLAMNFLTILTFDIYILNVTWHLWGLSVVWTCLMCPFRWSGLERKKKENKHWGFFLSWSMTNFYYLFHKFNFFLKCTKSEETGFITDSFLLLIFPIFLIAVNMQIFRISFIIVSMYFIFHGSRWWQSLQRGLRKLSMRNWCGRWNKLQMPSQSLTVLNFSNRNGQAECAVHEWISTVSDFKESGVIGNNKGW